MWLSQKLRAARTAEETAADLGVTTIGIFLCVHQAACFGSPKAATK